MVLSRDVYLDNQKLATYIYISVLFKKLIKSYFKGDVKLNSELQASCNLQGCYGRTKVTYLCQNYCNTANHTSSFSDQEFSIPKLSTLSLGSPPAGQTEQTTYWKPTVDNQIPQFELLRKLSLLAGKNQLM